MSAPIAPSRARAFLARHSGAVAAVVIALLVLFAWFNRFMQDDAFISFRYARHLVEGHGLVWNVGERIEGYTNFLWVLVIAGGLSLGFDPVLWSQGAGLVLFAGTLWMAWRLTREVTNDEIVALVALAALGANYTISIYATGGLETQLQAFSCASVAACAAAAMRRGTWNSSEILALSAAMTAALLTRLDSAIVCVTAAAFCLLAWRREPRAVFARRIALLVSPAALVVGGWLLWKLSYYGGILPNTFRVKGSFDAFARGGWYLHRFATSYLLYPLAVLGVAGLPRFAREATRTMGMLAVMVGATLLYIVSVGGDFMEFRFLVTPLILAAPLGAWLVGTFVTHRALRALAVALLAYGSLHHATTFRYDSFYEIESKAMLQGHLTLPNEQWVNIGTVLGDAFGHDPAVRIAVTAAGAIPYYSGLTTIDMLGLSDRFVPTGGIVLGNRPGHQRIAPLSYLRERGVHLAVSHPTVVPAGSPTFVAPFLPRAEGEPVPDIPLVEIPLDPGHTLVVWYLTADPRVDEVIRRNGWKLTRVSADGPVR
jgi:hypothetical protein